MKKFFKRTDVLIIGGVLAAALIWLLVASLTAKTGEYVVVTVADKPYAELPLDKDAQLRIETDEGYNLLVIRDGQAWVESADCYNQVCVHTGKVSKELDSIICLPHRVVITIERKGN
ncbi:MAG: NusG domain II-containing protein [Oscillospiraceae bacterium]|nr:NusG domain II-containing protein [Oscillospiraceae bacterium]